MKKRKTKIVGIRYNRLNEVLQMSTISYVLEEINYVHSCKPKFYFGVMRGGGVITRTR